MPSTNQGHDPPALHEAQNANIGPRVYCTEHVSAMLS